MIHVILSPKSWQLNKRDADAGESRVSLVIDSVVVFNSKKFRKVSIQCA